jgi:hypothetical protein
MGTPHANARGPVVLSHVLYNQPNCQRFTILIFCNHLGITVRSWDVLPAEIIVRDWKTGYIGMVTLHCVWIHLGSPSSTEHWITSFAFLSEQRIMTYNWYLVERSLVCSFSYSKEGTGENFWYHWKTTSAPFHT